MYNSFVYHLYIITTKVTLPVVLAFFTGVTCVPPLGLSGAVLNFNSMYAFPSASVCGFQLTLPTKFEKYEEFKTSLNVAFSKHGGFHLI